MIPELSKYAQHKPSLVNLSVEEENLAAIPFAVLERRVGKRIGKLELKGSKVLPDGTPVRVIWQVQGNNELGLPTEKDLDIFVALGVLTFQSNFSKTVTFTGRELARILNIKQVHGKYYQRLKLAMDRFIPLRFRALSATDKQEEVKWLNVFQEASFTLDRSTGRCTGSVTWTDKVIQSMDSGFFRLLDANRYMELDGITAKHLYRYLAVAFEKNDVVIIDARQLATEHLGIPTPPKYLSRLMQTLEPAFDQLISIDVLKSYHVVDTESWQIALYRHPEYVSESKTLMIEAAASPEMRRTQAMKALERAGVPARATGPATEAANSFKHFYAIQRAAGILEALRELGVMAHAALHTVRSALDQLPWSKEGQEILDLCEVAIEACREKQRAGQRLNNSGGLIMKLIRDPETRQKVVGEKQLEAWKQRFREQEEATMRQEREADQRSRVLEYERFRQDLAAQLFREIPDDRRRALRKEKFEILERQDRFMRLSPEMRDQEADEMIMADLAQTEAPPFERWEIRRSAGQAIFPFASGAQAG